MDCSDQRIQWNFVRNTAAGEALLDMSVYISGLVDTVLLDICSHYLKSPNLSLDNPKKLMHSRRARMYCKCLICLYVQMYITFQ